MPTAIEIYARYNQTYQTMTEKYARRLAQICPEFVYGQQPVSQESINLLHRYAKASAALLRRRDRMYWRAIEQGR